MRPLCEQLIKCITSVQAKRDGKLELSVKIDQVAKAINAAASSSQGKWDTVDTYER